MREIRFRAWNKRACRMEAVITLEFNGGGNIDAIQTDYYSDKEDANRFEVMQFTGLKDKNGKEIYEGDVVKHREREVGNLEVKFWNGEWIGEANDTAAQPLFDEDWWRKSKGADKITNIEVVGNIYENPELLK